MKRYEINLLDYERIQANLNDLRNKKSALEEKLGFEFLGKLATITAEGRVSI